MLDQKHRGPNNCAMQFYRRLQCFSIFLLSCNGKCPLSFAMSVIVKLGEVIVKLGEVHHSNNKKNGEKKKRGKKGDIIVFLCVLLFFGGGRGHFLVGLKRVRFSTKTLGQSGDGPGL